MPLTRPKHAGLRHVALNVLDLAKVETFYVDLLGFKACLLYTSPSPRDRG